MHFIQHLALTFGNHGVWRVAYYVVVLFGLNLSVWGLIGLLRWVLELLGKISIFRKLFSAVYVRNPLRLQLQKEQVAVLLPAYNEELVIAKSLASLLAIVPAENIYVVSDGSKDNTADISRSLGVNVLELPNQGKAGALKDAIEYFELADRYVGVLFVDADTIISPDYLTYALPYLEDSRVAAVAGFARTLWQPEKASFSELFILAHRERVYLLAQYLLKYAQAWLPLSLTPIIPGFCSLYRASILKNIDIAATGLVIEDYNMTFEIHHNKLGKIILDTRVYGNTQDPHSLGDYYKQVRRWHLGLWQTIKRHGFWPSLFSLALLIYIAEVVLAALSLLILPFAVIFVVYIALIGSGSVAPWLGNIYDILTGPYNVFKFILVIFALDYGVSLIVGLLLRRPQYIWYGLGFLFMKYIDAWTFLVAFPRAFFEHSTGAWKSPARRHIG